MRDTPYPWLMPGDANMEPETFAQGKWFNERATIIRVPAADVSTCRSKGPDGVEVEVERMYEYVVAWRGPDAKLQKGEVVDDFDSRPRKFVRFEVRRKGATRREDIEESEAATRLQRRKSSYS